MCGLVPPGVASTTVYPASIRAIAGTTISLRYCPIAAESPPWSSIRVAFEPTTSTVPLVICASIEPSASVADEPDMTSANTLLKLIVWI